MARNVLLLALFVILPAAWAEVEWTSPVLINDSTAEVDTNRDHIDIATDGQGTWFTAWSETDASIHPEWDIVFGSTSTDNGETWSERYVVAAPGGKGVKVVYSAGVWGAIFFPIGGVDGNGLPEGIHLVRSTDLVHWMDVQTIDLKSVGSYRDVREMELRAVGATWIISWEEAPHYNAFDVDGFYVRSEDAGATWTQRTWIGPWFEHDGGVDRAPTVCGREDGVWVCAWRTHQFFEGYDVGTDPDLYFCYSRDYGRTWSQAALVDADYSVRDNTATVPPYQESQDNPTLSTDGHLFLLTFIDIGSIRRMGYSVSRDGANWTPYAFFEVPRCNPEDQSTVSDGRGNWFTTFDALSASDTRGVYGAALELSAVGNEIHLEWGEVRLLAQVEGYECLWPRIATDRTGNWVVTWLSRPEPGLLVQGNRLLPTNALTAETMTNVKSASLGASAQMTGVFHWRAME